MTPKQEAFVREYLIDLNATASYRRAGYAAKGHAAEVNASLLLRNTEVASAISAAVAARAARTMVSADQVVRELQVIAHADPRELTEFRRLCCRFCYGANFRYQRTAGEMERDREVYVQKKAQAKKRLPPFDEKGGVGYHAKKDPNPDCPECFGDGIGYVHINDTRHLSQSAARLFAGVKRTKDGIEVMTRGQDNALIHLGKHVGAFKERIEVTDTTDLVAALDVAWKQAGARGG